jgi:hypothetical protein
MKNFTSEIIDPRKNIRTTFLKTELVSFKRDRSSDLFHEYNAHISEDSDMESEPLLQKVSPIVNK